jgi:pfkB family carbohydrate kinase
MGIGPAPSAIARCAGAVTYAAAVARGFGRSACILTAAADEKDVAVLAGHSVHRVPSPATLTFEHSYTWFGNHRRLKVPQMPGVVLSARQVPFRCRCAKTLLLGPLIPTDVDVASFTQPHSTFFRMLLHLQHVGVMGQGVQREVKPDGRVVHLTSPSATLAASVAPNVHLFLSDVETDPWPSQDFEAMVDSVRALIVTRGEKGVSVHRTHSDTLHIPARAIKAVDTNGAGDTFATSYMLAVSRHRSVEDAGMQATWAASRVCLQPQECKPACCTLAVRERDDLDTQPHPRKKMPELFREVPVLPVSEDALPIR